MPKRKHVTDSARKRAKQQWESERSRTRINIKSAYEKWVHVMAANGFATHEEMANFLLGT